MAIGNTPGTVSDNYREQIWHNAAQTGTISAGGGAGSSSITLAAAPAGLVPGMEFGTTGGTAEPVPNVVTTVSGSTVTFTPAFTNGAHTGITYGYGAVSDDFRQNAVYGPTPLAPTRQITYPQQATTDNWQGQHKQKLIQY